MSDKQDTFVKLLEKATIDPSEKDDFELIIEDQYQRAYEGIMDAYNAGLYAGLIGPVGVGKTAICRRMANDLGTGFYWVTFSDLVRPSTLIGTFDPTLVFNKGYKPESFIPGSFTLACLEGAVFLANEFNRGDEFVLNSLLDALEERRLYIPQLRRWIRVHPNFYFIAAMNPAELKGTRRLPQAVKDRIKVWVKLSYPKKKTEEKIVRVNAPEWNLPDQTLDLILELIARLRANPFVELPPSIRSSIAIARLLSIRKKNDDKEPSNQDIIEVAMLVLPEAIQTTPGTDSYRLIQGVCNDVLGIKPNG